MSDRRLGEIRVHPLKGAAGILIDRVELDPFGPRHDRRWMAIGPDGVFLSQRNSPALALVDTALEDDTLCLRSRGPDLSPLRVPAGGRSRSVRVWLDEVEARDCGDEAAEWLTAALGEPARLVHFPDDGERAVATAYGRPGDRVAFADAFPILLLARASLDDLNARLPRPLPMERFRPNLVIDGAEAYEEDRWRRIRVGDVTLDVVKPCARCLVTTTDQRTGARGKEPLRTLARYRRLEGHVWFAWNAIHRGSGALRVGDPVEVLEVGEPPVFEGGDPPQPDRVSG